MEEVFQTDVSQTHSIDEELDVFQREMPNVPPMLRRGTLSKSKSTLVSTRSQKVPKAVFDLGISNVWRGKIEDAKIMLKVQNDSTSKARLGIAEIYLCAFSWDSLKENWHPRGTWQPNESSYSVMINGEIRCDNDLNCIIPRISLVMQFAKLLKHVEVKKPINKFQLTQFIEIHGHLCLSLLFRGIVFMAWSPLRSIMCLRRLMKMISSPDWYDSDMHITVFGIIHMYCTQLSLANCKIIGIAPDLSNAVNKLEYVAIKDTEASHYAKLALLHHYLMYVDMVFRSDRSVYLKKAYELVTSTLCVHPDWILFQWAETHVLKHFGRLKDASLKLQDIYKIYKSPIVQWELASIAFVSKNWPVCEELLDEDDKKEEIFLLYSACTAMKGFNMETGVDPIVESVNYLDNGINLGTQSWKKKFEVLKYRPHKSTLYYEMCYFMGYLKWFEIEITTGLRMGGGLTCRQWLERVSVELEIMDEGSDVSVVYPDRLSTHEEAREEFLAVCHLRGAVASSHGDFELATKCFKRILDNSFIVSDPWHYSFTHLELGFMYIRKGMYIDAKNEFIAVLQNKQNFVFKKLAIKQSTIALTYLKNMKLVTMGTINNTNNDVLGPYNEKSGTTHKEFKIIVVSGGQAYDYKINMIKEQTISWIWAVESGGIKFKVTFTHEKTIEIIEEYKTEVGDENTSFFTSKEDGILVLKWDNTDNINTERCVNYIVY
jgi:hypothetical protein